MKDIKSEKFGHEYWFNFQNEEDSNSYELTKFECLDSNPKFSVKLLDFYGEPIIPSYFTIKNIANDSLIFAFATDEEGEINIEPDSGYYFFDLRTTFYDKF